MTSYLESLASHVRTPCPYDITRHLAFVTEPQNEDEPRPAVATVAAELLARLRQVGQLPTASALAPVPVHGRDAVDTLAQLARIYRAERKPPAQVRVNTAVEVTASFLTSLALDKSECPSSIAADIGLMNNPCTMAEAAVSLHGRFRQAGAL